MRRGKDTPDLHSLPAKLGEAKLRMALLEAARQEADEVQAMWDALPDEAPEKMAEKAFHLETEEKLLGRMRRAERGQTIRKTAMRSLRYAAALVLVCAVGCGIAMAVSGDVRQSVWRLFAPDALPHHEKMVRADQQTGAMQAAEGMNPYSLPCPPVSYYGVAEMPFYGYGGI